VEERAARELAARYGKRIHVARRPVGRVVSKRRPGNSVTLFSKSSWMSGATALS
jgi:hypothetical protein